MIRRNLLTLLLAVPLFVGCRTEDENKNPEDESLFYVSCSAEIREYDGIPNGDFEGTKVDAYPAPSALFEVIKKHLNETAVIVSAEDAVDAMEQFEAFLRMDKDWVDDTHFLVAHLGDSKPSGDYWKIGKRENWYMHPVKAEKNAQNKYVPVLVEDEWMQIGYVKDTSSKQLFAPVEALPWPLAEGQKAKSNIIRLDKKK